jgi:hypothetical protein
MASALRRFTGVALPTHCPQRLRGTVKPVQRYVSDELTHLTGRGKSDEDAYGALLSILRSGTLRHSGEATPHGTFPDNPLGGGVAWSPAADLIAHEMFKADIVCFCDIPVPDLAIHAGKYSRFGLAFPKTFLLAKGAAPVFYVASDAVTSGGGTLAELFDVEVQRFHRFFQVVRDAHAAGANDQGEGIPEEEVDRDIFLLSMRVMAFLNTRVFAFVKFFEALLPPDDQHNYYMEREWRVLGGVSFKLADVSRVLVPAEYARRLPLTYPATRAKSASWTHDAVGATWTAGSTDG